MGEIKPRAKFGYLSYDDMLSKIHDEILDAYDICYTKDTKEFFIIKEDLTPSPVRSKVYVFHGESDAIEKINQNTDTYNGQIIAVLNGGSYRGYIVNTQDNRFVITPLYEHPDQINYDTLGNRPIINIAGTLDDPINAEDLDTGIYKIRGQYTISSQLETVFLSVSDTILIVRHEEDDTFVKRITADEIVDYKIASGSITNSMVLTSDFLNNRGYATEEYVDGKIAALKIVTQDDVESYVQHVINNTFESVIEEKIDQKLDEKIQETSGTEIDSLF